jgi:hypothetical protein
VFEHLTIHGAAASILWGYRPAAVLRTWKIYQHEGQWMLSATVERVEAFLLRKSPLLFTAPHEKGRDGFWAWQVRGEVQVSPSRLVAKLGPPEQ